LDAFFCFCFSGKEATRQISPDLPGAAQDRGKARRE
jgi:hypothetical protein